MTEPMPDAELTHIQSLLDRGSQAFSRVYVTDLLAEVRRLRSQLATETATARDLLQRIVESETCVDNAKAACEDLREERDRLAQVANQRGAFAAKLSAQLAEIGQVKPEWGIGDATGPWTIDRYTEAAARASAPCFGDGARPIRRLAGEWRDAE